MRTGDLNERKNARGGFTLIEVLLVVAILGILAAIVVVNVSGRREEAMIQATRASISGVCAALSLYEVDTGKYPSSLQALVQKTDEPNWHGPYVNGGVPVDTWGTPLGYTKTENSYKVTSAGPDRSLGTSDDLTN